MGRSMNEDYSAVIGDSFWCTGIEVRVMSAIGKLGDFIMNDWHDLSPEVVRGLASARHR